MNSAPQTASAVAIDDRSSKTDDNGNRLCGLFFAMNGAGHAERPDAPTAVTGVGPSHQEPQGGLGRQAPAPAQARSRTL